MVHVDLRQSNEFDLFTIFLDERFARAAPTRRFVERESNENTNNTTSDTRLLLVLHCPLVLYVRIKRVRYKKGYSSGLFFKRMLFEKTKNAKIIN